MDPNDVIKMIRLLEEKKKKAPNKVTYLSKDLPTLLFNLFFFFFGGGHTLEKNKVLLPHQHDKEVIFQKEICLMS